MKKTLPEATSGHGGEYIEKHCGGIDQVDTSVTENRKLLKVWKQGKKARKATSNKETS